MSIDEHMTSTGSDTGRSMTGDVSFEAAVVVTGSVRVSVVAGSADDAHAAAREQVSATIKPTWDLLTLSLARALRDELEATVRTLDVARQLEDGELELLVSLRPQEDTDGRA